MIEMLSAREADIPDIIDLATETWWSTYQELVPAEQIKFMLERFYDPNVLLEQLSDPEHYIVLAREGDSLLGYAHLLEQGDHVKLSKLYVRPGIQGKGVGASLLKAIETETRNRGYQRLELCVNRGNPARYFYERQGFEITREADFPVGPYWMNDYVMQKMLKDAPHRPAR